MIRTVAESWLLFLIPFVIYGTYVLLVLRARGKPAPQTPWTTLFIVGLMLVVAGFIFVGLTEGETTKGVYVPPRVVDGRIVPGHVEKDKP